MEPREIKYNIFGRIFTFFSLIYFMVSILLFYIMPYILNFSRGMNNSLVQFDLDGGYYYQRFFLIVLLIYIISILLYFLESRKVDNLTIKNESEFLELKKRLVKLPFGINLKLLDIILFIILILHIFAIKHIHELTFKMALFFIPAVLFVCIISYLKTKSIIREILRRESDGTEYYSDNTKLFNISAVEFLQFSATVFITAILISYSIFLSQRTLYFNKYYNEEFKGIINKSNYEDLAQLQEDLGKIEKLYNKGCFFIYNSVDDNYKIIDAGNNEAPVLSDFFVEYMKEYSEEYNGIVYMSNGSYTQGFASGIKLNGIDHYVGIIYSIRENTYLLSLVAIAICITIVFNLLVFLRRKSFTYIFNKFKNILEEKNEKNDKIPIVSDDEYGELTYLYNRLKELTNENISSIKQNQEIIEEQEQLASIGELAGGIAHDINTPISAIKSGTMMFKEMYKNLNPKQMGLLTRINENSENITKIVNSMRNQIRNLGSNEKYVFKVSSAINEVKNIIDNKIIHSHCDININIIEDFELMGSLPKLVLVIDNILTNDTKAYGNKPGNIDVIVKKESSKTGVIEVTDYAGGIEDDIKNKIFKKIVLKDENTRNSIGLYIAYSVIKGVFGGEINIISKDGIGTTFEIKIPINGV